MLTITQLAAVIIGYKLPTTLHRRARLIGFLVAGTIELRTFCDAFVHGCVFVHDRNNCLLATDGTMDRMMSGCPDDDVRTVYAGQWFMAPSTLSWSRPVVGRDADGYFHPGAEFADVEEGDRFTWSTPFVSFAAARRVSLGLHREWRRKVSPFALV